MTWSSANAWREILERIFDGFEFRENLSPTWMVNPFTGRRLKLDRYYPDLGVAFRFVGMSGPANRRVSDKELQQEADRNNIREWLCRQQSVTLVQLDVNEPQPWRLVSRIRSALSRTSRLLAQSDVEMDMKRELSPRIARARQICDAIYSQVRNDEGLKLYADLWQDRQYARMSNPSVVQEPAQRPRRRYRQGMAVKHTTFGLGTVVEVRDDGEDATVIVRFDEGDERKFLASLVSDKLLPAR